MKYLTRLRIKFYFKIYFFFLSSQSQPRLISCCLHMNKPNCRLLKVENRKPTQQSSCKASIEYTSVVCSGEIIFMEVEKSAFKPWSHFIKQFHHIYNSLPLVTECIHFQKIFQSSCERSSSPSLHPALKGQH